jgi:FAD/FMN-containing dehydrogenase
MQLMESRELRLTALVALAGDCRWATDPARVAAYLTEHRGLYAGAALAVALPASAAQVSAVIRACAQLDLTVVPQGGNTGLCGGAVPREPERAVVVSLERMRSIRALDAPAYTLTAEAGCTVAAVKAAAAAAKRLFPLGFAAEGSARVGGVVSTNAGGHNVLRYGTTRELVLGLEVVLPDGRVWNGLSGLRKDNTGYDLKQLFIGAEGTLGVVTAATFKLFPAPCETATALVACADLEACVAVLARLRVALADQLVACELLSRTAVEFALRHTPACRDPFGAPQPWWLLVEAGSPARGAGLHAHLAAALGELLDAGLADDAVAAATLAQAADFWRVREAVPEAQRHEGASVKNDIALPIAAIPSFVAGTLAALERAAPGVRPCVFGHLGDGNLHFNLSRPPGVTDAAWLARWEELTDLVNTQVSAHGGSISAEHGIGRLKRPAFERHKDALSRELMARIKRALDPDGRMNPGVLLPEDAGPGET